MKKTLITLFILLIFNSSQAGWFDKKIKVSKCYDPKKYNNFKHKLKTDGHNDWSWEIDLEKGTAILSYIMPDNQLVMSKHVIKMQTDRYIIATDNKTPDVQFDLKNEVYISQHTPRIAEIVGYKNVMLKCKFN